MGRGWVQAVVGNIHKKGKLLLKINEKRELMKGKGDWRQYKVWCGIQAVRHQIFGD